jgi:sortase (surface protein transpeptidase)
VQGKVRFIGSIALLYLLTIAAVGYALQPSRLLTTPVHAQQYKSTIKHEPVKSRFVLVSGKPVRIIIPDYSIDLPIDEGAYDASGAWTLSDTRAQFALISAPANNAGGNTFIYGHGTDAVFGKLGATTPTPGTIAQIHTANGRIFTYRFVETRNLTAADTWVFDDVTSGAPRLTVQTCTGSFSEWRTMFTFAFEKVDKP